MSIIKEIRDKIEEVKIKSFVLSWNLKELTENFLKNING